MLLVKRTHIAILAALIAPVASGLAVSGSAYAAGCTGAPGASAIQQYCEAVPNADGSSTGGTSSKSKPNVSKSTAKALATDGADGAHVEALTSDGTANAASKSTGNGTASADKKSSVAGVTGSSGSDESVSVTSPKDPSASPLKAATHAVGSGPTVGTGLVWGVVGISALGAIGAVFVRRRSNGFDPPSDDS